MSCSHSAPAVHLRLPTRCPRIPALSHRHLGELGRPQGCSSMRDATNVVPGATPPCKQGGQKQQHSPWSAPRQRKRRPPAQQVAASLQSVDEEPCWASPPKRLNGEQGQGCERDGGRSGGPREPFEQLPPPDDARPCRRSVPQAAAAPQPANCPCMPNPWGRRMVEQRQRRQPSPQQRQQQRQSRRARWRRCVHGHAAGIMCRLPASKSPEQAAASSLQPARSLRRPPITSFSLYILPPAGPAGAT